MIGIQLDRQISNPNRRKSVNKIMKIQEKMKSMNEQTLKWFDKLDQDQKDNEKFICILLDTLSYDHQALIENSFKIFLRLFTSKRILTNLLKEMQILQHPEAVKILFKVNDTVLIMEKDLENQIEWISSENGVPPRAEEKFRTAIECI